MDTPDVHLTKDSDIAFRDPLGDEARKSRMHLMFVSTMAILSKTYDLRITKTPWLDLEIPVNAPGILEGALSVALVYCLVSFLLYAWIDFRRWRLAGEVHLVHGSFDLLLQTHNDVHNISQNMDPLTSDQPLNSLIRTAVSDAAVRIPKSMAKVDALRAQLRKLNRLQWLRLVVLELGAPLALGTLALVKIWPAVIPFVQAVLK